VFVCQCGCICFAYKYYELVEREEKIARASEQAKERRRNVRDEEKIKSDKEIQSTFDRLREKERDNKQASE